jgi:hypothetical protein
MTSTLIPWPGFGLIPKSAPTSFALLHAHQPYFSFEAGNGGSFLQICLAISKPEIDFYSNCYKCLREIPEDSQIALKNLRVVFDFF